MFRGSLPALITPFTKDGARIDEDSFAELIEWQISEGSHGLVAVGSTGESPTLSHEEHHATVKLCVKVANKRVPVIAGAGSNSTKEAISLAQHGKDAGADGLLIVAPYYNKPNQNGIYAHYKAISESTDLPIIVYNNPKRSIVNISVETMDKLAQLPSIIGVKDATADHSRIGLQRLASGNDFLQLSGEDAVTLGLMAHGGHGWISVIGNIAPRLCAELQTACLDGDFITALAINDRLAPLYKALALETNPAPIKYAASRLGLCSNSLRLPLMPVTSQTSAAIDQALDSLGLI